MLANNVCPSKFLHYLQGNESYLANAKIKEPDHEFNALLTTQRLLFLEGPQKKVKWAKRIRELSSIESIPEDRECLCISYHQDAPEGEAAESLKTVLTVKLRFGGIPEAEEWYWILNRCLRDAWQSYLELAFIMSPEIYQTHLFFTTTEEFIYPGTFLSPGYTYLLVFSTTHLYILDTYSSLIDVRNQLMKTSLSKLAALYSSPDDFSLIQFAIATDSKEVANMKFQILSLQDRQKLLYETMRLYFKTNNRMIPHFPIREKSDA